MSRMVRKLFSVLLIAGYLSSPAFAGDPTFCETVLKKILLKNIGGEWVAIFEENQPLNLFSHEPLVEIKNDGKIPSGKYTNVKIVISETFTVSGSDSGNFTKEGGEAVLSGSAPRASKLPGEFIAFEERSPTWSQDSEGRMKIHLDLDYRDRDDVIEIYAQREIQDPLIVKEKSTLRVWCSMRLIDTLHFALPNTLGLNIPAGKAMYFLPPKTPGDISIRVDGVTQSFSGDNLVMEF